MFHMKRVLFILILAFNAFLLNAQTTTTSTNGSEITFNKLVHDYGTVAQGADGNCEFVFTNSGNEPLILSNVQTSCGCTVPSWPKEPVMPGKTGTIKVNYTKMSIAGTISKQITVYSNAKNGTIVLSIKGTVTEKPKITSPEKPVNEGFTPIAK